LRYSIESVINETLLDDFGFERDIAENGKIAVEKCKVILYGNFDGSSNA
jgi:hypothetical protein